MSSVADCAPCKGGYYCFRVGSSSFDKTLNDTGTAPCAAGFYCKSGGSVYTVVGAGLSSGGKGLNHLIDPAQWMHLQFGLVSVPTSDPTTGPSKAVVCAVLSVGKCI